VTSRYIIHMFKLLLSLLQIRDYPPLGAVWSVWPFSLELTVWRPQ